MVECHDRFPMAQCEVCGNEIRSQPVTVVIDEAVFRVCPPCSRLGKPAPGLSRDAAGVVAGLSPSRLSMAIQKPQPLLPPQPELELRSDYSREVKQAREKLGLSQEQVGHKINEKPSVIRLLETGKLKPDDILTRKIEHLLKIKLLVPTETEL